MWQYATVTTRATRSNIKLLRVFAIECILYASKNKQWRFLQSKQHEPADRCNGAAVFSLRKELHF